MTDPTWEESQRRLAASADAGRERLRRAKLTPAQRAYEDEHGREAAERQAALARDHHGCCGEPVTGPHHTACAKYEPEAAVTVHPAQASLL